MAYTSPFQLLQRTMQTTSYDNIYVLFILGIGYSCFVT